MQGMSEGTKGGAHGPLMFAAIGLLVLLPAAYLLLDGPAIWLETRGYLPRGSYDILYAPLIWAAQQSETIANALTWYESWFFDEEWEY